MSSLLHRVICAILFLLACTVIGGCGGGGGGAPAGPPTKAVVKLKTTGTLPVGITGIGAIDATVVYPTSAAKGLSITATDVVASGAAAGINIVPNTAVSGEVRTGSLTASGAGFPVGEFATLTFSIATGGAPVVGDFSVNSSNTTILASDDALTDLTSKGIAVEVMSVTFQ